MPIWFVGGVMFVFAPEIGRAMGIAEPIAPAKVIFWAYLGVVVGDVASGTVSQLLQSRTRTIIGFLALLAAIETRPFPGALARRSGSRRRRRS